MLAMVGAAAFGCKAASFTRSPGLKHGHLACDPVSLHT
jgi:hypothetical protein